ncbi:MAG: BMP family ABC transporter substrate-binding protein [Clostridia bacterium]|nr:BMP family ABC transporter substrate-binding protein [Clostridia bacterium]
MKKLLSIVLALCLALALAAPAMADGTVKIGMVTDVGGINDNSFNQFAWAGLQELAAEDPTFVVNYLESKTDADYQTNINTFIDEEYDLIICVGYMLADATRDAALDNPEQKFAIVDDASNADLENVACLTFAQEQCSYLVGLVAGYMTQSKTVGYVQGMVSDSMNLFGVGFISGVLEACPDAAVLQYNANNFGDIAGGATAAKDMITKGADVIYQAAGGTGIGVLNTCEEEKIWGIGVDADQAAVLGLNYVLCSALKNTGAGCVSIAKAVKAGEFAGGVHHYTLSDGAIDIATTGDHIPAEVLEKVEAAKAAIIAGEMTVPTSVDDCPLFTLDD